MSLNTTQARDEVHALFKLAWDAGAPGIPLLYWDTAQVVPTTGAWARITMKHVVSGQTTLSGETGQRRFTRTGVITVQIFTPTGDGNVNADLLANVAKNAFEGVHTPGDIWFRDVTATEVGQEGVWFQTNVTAAFIYDEVR